MEPWPFIVFTLLNEEPLNMQEKGKPFQLANFFVIHLWMNRTSFSSFSHRLTPQEKKRPRGSSAPFSTKPSGFSIVPSFIIWSAHPHARTQVKVVKICPYYSSVKKGLTLPHWHAGSPAAPPLLQISGSTKRTRTLVKMDLGFSPLGLLCIQADFRLFFIVIVKFILFSKVT